MNKRVKTALIAALVLTAVVFALGRTGVTTFAANWYPVVHEKLFGVSYTFPAPTNQDDIALLQASENATSDVFGGFVEVLASLPKESRY